ncbi:hypothetical protein LSAT2_033070 [Lamellibrachia satsuma]|nr:hypothetical protein LSAT2_033070 [Lamellibrachia satsuma]
MSFWRYIWPHRTITPKILVQNEIIFIIGEQIQQQFIGEQIQQQFIGEQIQQRSCPRCKKVMAVTIQHSTCAALDCVNPGAAKTPVVVSGLTTLPSTCVAVDGFNPGAATTPAVVPWHTALLSTCVAVEPFNPGATETPAVVPGVTALTLSTVAATANWSSEIAAKSSTQFNFSSVVLVLVVPYSVDMFNRFTSMLHHAVEAGKVGYVGPSAILDQGHISLTTVPKVTWLHLPTDFEIKCASRVKNGGLRKNFEMVYLSSLKLFEAILMKPTNEIVHSLILQDLLTRSYWRQTEGGEYSTRDTGKHSTCDTGGVPVADTFDLCDNACVARDMQTSGATQRIVMQDNSSVTQCEGVGTLGWRWGGKSSVVMITEGGGGDAGDVIVMNGDVPEMAFDVTDEGKVSDEDTDGSMVNSAPSLASNVCYDVHEIVAKSVQPDLWKSGIYNVNLQLTSVVSCLALLPHLNIHEYLLNPLLPLQDNCRTLPVVLKKVAAEVEHRMKSTPNFQVRLMMARKHLMGMSTNMRSSVTCVIFVFVPALLPVSYLCLS